MKIIILFCFTDFYKIFRFTNFVLQGSTYLATAAAGLQSSLVNQSFTLKLYISRKSTYQLL